MFCIQVPGTGKTEQMEFFENFLQKVVDKPGIARYNR